jgi:hypothetical protein
MNKPSPYGAPHDPPLSADNHTETSNVHAACVWCEQNAKTNAALWIKPVNERYNNQIVGSNPENRFWGIGQHGERP